MEWWLKAGLAIVGVSSAFTANHLWKEHYRLLGVEHPITQFLRELIVDEEEDRKKRIDDIAIQSALSEARLAKMSKSLPFKRVDRDSAVGNVSNKQPLLNEAWKSDFQ